MKWRPSLLILCAAAAGVSAVANAVAQPEQTRLGAAVEEDIGGAARAAAGRKRQLDMREQAVRAAEQRLQSAAGLAPGAAAKEPPIEEKTDDQRYEDLGRIYQAMKPKAAAAVFEQLALEVQVRVAEKMRERSTAQIMAAMSPGAAAKLTMAFARRQTGYTVLPNPTDAKRGR